MHKYHNSTDENNWFNYIIKKDLTDHFHGISIRKALAAAYKRTKVAFPLANPVSDLVSPKCLDFHVSWSKNLKKKN